MSKRFAKIIGVRSALPAQLLTNQQLEAEFPEWNVAKIYAKTGIHTRRIAGPDECASDLGVAAAQRLFEAGIVKPAEVDFLLFCTQSPDFFLPTTACLVQHRLGLPTSCGALDINLGCSGFVYGLSLAKGLIETGQANNVLLVTADTYTKFLAAKDKTVRTIFGDGAAATLISGVTGDRPFLGPFIFGTDGAGADHLIVKNGACRSRAAAADGDHLYMNGPEIYSFTLRAVPELVHALLRKTESSLAQVDTFLLHQANHFMLDSIRQKLGIPAEKLGFHLQAVGNTVSSTIPMALEILLREGTIGPAHRVMMLGFGVGYSWAGCMAGFE